MATIRFPSAAETGASAQAIREWAQAEGLIPQGQTRGRLSADVLKAYKDTHPHTTPELAYQPDGAIPGNAELVDEDEPKARPDGK